MFRRSGYRFADKNMRQSITSRTWPDSEGTGHALKPDFLESAAHPRAFVFERLEPAGFHEAEGVLVPAAVGKVMAEHGGRGLRLAGNAERQVDLGQPIERLFDVARRLILRHHDLEAVDRADEVTLLLIVAPNLHFLAGDVVARHLDLMLGAHGVFGVGDFARHL